jgi:hypothetical protein
MVKSNIKNGVTISSIILLIIVFSFTCLYFLQRNKPKETDQIQILLKELNEVVELMDTIKNEMPKELLETHEYLMSGALGSKLYRANPKFKDLIMYHGAKTKSIYINPTIKIKKEL